jgi:hypothetical protein
VRFLGLMAVLTVLLSVSVISGCQSQKPGPNVPNEQPSGPGGAGKFYGKVTNKNTGANISNVQLYFAGPSKYPMTSTDGNYLTIWLNSGIYQITVTASGYQQINDSNVTLPDGALLNRNYSMTPQ